MVKEENMENCQKGLYLISQEMQKHVNMLKDDINDIIESWGDYTILSIPYKVGEFVYVAYDTFYSKNATVKDGKCLHKWQLFGVTEIKSITAEIKGEAIDCTYNFYDEIFVGVCGERIDRSCVAIKMFKTREEAVEKIKMLNKSMEGKV